MAHDPSPNDPSTNVPNSNDSSPNDPRSSLPAEATLPVARSTRWADFLELTKPRITFMVLLTTAAGYLLAAPRPISWWLLWHVILGTALVASGASAFNQVLERETDALMRRTARRPLPSGRLQLETALGFSVAISILGVAYLALLVNLLTAAVGAFTLGVYVLVYTPMKRRSSLATIVGAVPGAAPPVMGCTAATGELGTAAWVLFAILFLWQMPHFLAIAWLYRSDYQRGGFPLLTLGPSPARATARQMVLYSAALLPVSLLPSVLGFSGAAYFWGALTLGLVFLGYSFAFGRNPSAAAARRLLLASVLYLPVVLLLMVADQVVV